NLSELGKVVDEETTRRSAAQRRLAQAQAAFDEQQWHAGSELLAEAFASSNRAPAAQAKVIDAFIQASFLAVETDWRAAESILKRLAALKPDYDPPSLLRLKIREHEREEAVGRYLGHSKALIAMAKLQEALDKVSEGLESHPNDVALLEVRKSLLGRIQREEERARQERARLEKEAFLRDVSNRVEREPSLERRIAIIEEALTQFPQEQQLQRQSSTTRDLVLRVTAITADARRLEADGKYDEALVQWNILRSLHPLQPELDSNVARVTRQREQAKEREREKQRKEELERERIRAEEAERKRSEKIEQEKALALQRVQEREREQERLKAQEQERLQAEKRRLEEKQRLQEEEFQKQEQLRKEQQQERERKEHEKARKREERQRKEAAAAEKRKHEQEAKRLREEERREEALQKKKKNAAPTPVPPHENAEMSATRVLSTPEPPAPKASAKAADRSEDESIPQTGQLASVNSGTRKAIFAGAVVLLIAGAVVLWRILVPHTIAIQVTSIPDGASVTLTAPNQPKFKRECVTPRCRLDLDPGSYALEIRHEGFEPSTQTIQVDANGARTFPVTLVATATPSGRSISRDSPKMVDLEVRGLKDGSELYVDGKSAGRVGHRGEIAVQVPAGEHRVKVL
ncbi:MAG TPA: PEGA domain-containing protein, partial [Blastocatellia bacterium]|nr:PEGA domain-containing protein [Blastocatellia bacterium]